MDKLYLDDLHVGDTFESREIQISEEQIIEFASLYDPQPFHIDPDAARATFFGELPASGWHTMGITMRLIVESVPIAGGIIGAGAEVTWPRPTRPGDVLRVRSQVTAVTPSKSREDRGMVILRSLTFGGDGEVRQDFTARLMVFKKS